MGTWGFMGNEFDSLSPQPSTPKINKYLFFSNFINLSKIPTSIDIKQQNVFNIRHSKFLPSKRDSRQSRFVSEVDLEVFISTLFWWILICSKVFKLYGMLFNHEVSKNQIMSITISAIPKRLETIGICLESWSQTIYVNTLLADFDMN